MSLLDRIRTMGFNPVANGFSASAAMPEKLFPGGPGKIATNAARLGPLAAASVMAALAVYQKVKGPIEAFMRRHLQENPEQGARIMSRVRLYKDRIPGTFELLDEAPGAARSNHGSPKF